jgi:hypothetical protein
MRWVFCYYKTYDLGSNGSPKPVSGVRSSGVSPKTFKENIVGGIKIMTDDDEKAAFLAEMKAIVKKYDIVIRLRDGQGWNSYPDGIVFYGPHWEHEEGGWIDKDSFCG